MSRQIFAYMLVVIQFATLFILFGTGLEIPTHPVGWVLGVGGAVLGLWALFTMRPDRVNVLPTVKSGSDLVTNGPYQWIRHPMYTALLMVGAALALNPPHPWRWAVWVLLFVNQTVKLLYEEKLLQLAFLEYRTYMARTKRLIPFIF